MSTDIIAGEELDDDKIWEDLEELLEVSDEARCP